MAEFWPENADSAASYPDLAAKNTGVSANRREFYPTAPPPRLECGMFEKTGPNGLEHWRRALDEALDGACTALAEGDHSEAERRARAVTALAKAARETAEFAEYARARAPEEDEESLRAELRRRVARFVEAERLGADLETLERVGAGELPR